MPFIQLLLEMLKPLLEMFMAKKAQPLPEPKLEEPKLEPKQPLLEPLQAQGLPIIWKASPNYSVRPNREISALILHHTATFAGNQDLEWLCNPDAKVSAHYVIDLDGKIYQLVRDEDVSWACGVSSWKGRSYVNNFSISIEVVGDTNKKEFTKEEYNSLILLVKHLAEKYNIKPEDIISHREISPGRKTDLNSQFFDWHQFYKDLGFID